MKCPRCPGQDLLEGAILSAWSCPRCGGGLVPDDGAHRLLVDDLGHDRAQLQELASLVGGLRVACPACRGRMSPLQLRGALLDLCFQCGALWVDAGELEKVSASRYTLPRTLAVTRPAPAAATQALVRVNERPPWMRAVRSALWFYGGLGVVASIAGSPLAPTLVFTVPALLGAAALSKRHITDLLPRARRVRRWRGLLPPDRPALDDELPSDAVLLLSALPGWGGGLLRKLELVDLEGRVITTLRHVLPIEGAARVGAFLSQSLGVPLREDEPRPAEPLEAEPSPVPDHDELIAQEDDAPGAGRLQISFSAPGIGVIAYATHEGTVVNPRSLRSVLNGDWVIKDAQHALLARLLPSARWQQNATLLVGPSGALLGHVLLRRTFFADTLEWASPARRRLISLRVPHGLGDGKLRDLRGRARGSAHVTRRVAAPATVTFMLKPHTFVGATRVGALALALHASLASAVVDP